MSWGQITATTTVSTFDDDLAAAKAAYEQTLKNNDYELDADAQGQVDAAIASAKILVASGAVGDDTQHFTVTLSGHANPSHAPTPGYANDSIYVSVAQAAVKE